MLYQQKKQFEAVPAAINMQLLLGLAGSLITAVQILFIVIRGDILCLNEGCEIVESLTAVPPIFFNLAGLFYFQAIFWTLRRGRNGMRFRLDWAKLLLLAGLAAEGVLIGFQYYVAETFCSYCLIIFSFVLLLNLLMGVRQILAGAAVFAAVLIAFLSLELQAVGDSAPMALERGTYARIEGADASAERYFFFSSSCSHCEEVLATIDTEFNCSLNFNPIDVLDSLAVPQAVQTPDYLPAVNRSFLKNLGISAIPVLVVKAENELNVLHGKQRILEYLDENCRRGAVESVIIEGASGMSSQISGYDYLSPAPRDDSCSVEEDCVEIPAVENSQ